VVTRTGCETSLISWNLTRMCNLRCPHCYTEAGPESENKLTTEECLGLIDGR
jgi:MoaA/NifB/PqqE/SkfB family radical SAM enzyme